MSVFEEELKSILSFTNQDTAADTQPTPPVKPSPVLVAEPVYVAPLEDAKTTSNEPITVDIPEPIYMDYAPKSHNSIRLNWKIFAGLGAFALVAGLAAGVHTTTPENNATTPPKPVTTLGALPTSSAAPSDAPTEPSVKDYSIDYISIGPQNKNYKPLGVYATAATQLIATVRNHQYLVTMQPMNVSLTSSAKKVGESFQNDGTAHNSIENNEAYKKKATIDQADIQGSASFAKGTKVPTIKPLSELQGMLDTHPSYTADKVCRSLPLLDGCFNKKSWALTKAEKNKITYGALALAMYAVQKSCAVVEMDTVKKTEAAAFAAQAITQGVNPDLIELVYLHPSYMPNYSKPALASIAKKGGETSVKKLATLFPNPAITTTCIASPVVPAKG